MTRVPDPRAQADQIEIFEKSARAAASEPGEAGAIARMAIRTMRPFLEAVADEVGRSDNIDDAYAASVYVIAQLVSSTALSFHDGSQPGMRLARVISEVYGTARGMVASGDFHIVPSVEGGNG